MLTEPLRCPHCPGRLVMAGRSLRCDNGHNFDVARQGYVALEKHRAKGDTNEMVAAREAFQVKGHYAPIATAIAALAPPTARTVVDLGAGTGYYLARTLAALPDANGIALDSSRPALRRAVKHPRIDGVACDIWAGLPLADNAADAILNVFAPRNAPEIIRVLAPNGTLIVVTPTPHHLQELELLGVHPGKREHIQATLKPLERASQAHLEFRLDLTADDVEALVKMGPSAHHGYRANGPASVTASVVIETYRG